MFHIDTFRLIKKTFKRFITIMLIVLIGVGFMVGLMSSAPTMRASVDRYFDRTNFMDIQLYSSYGFDDRDVDALKAAENVEDVYATKFVDVFVRDDESSIVTRVQELGCDINTIQLVEGRMPRKPGEALALGSSSFGAVFAIGDKVQLYLEDSDLSESLSATEYEIVGLVKTPQYMASSRETSTLNNLNLSTVIFVDPDNFISEYYTSVYLTFKGSSDYVAFTDEYKDFIRDNKKDLEKVIRKQSPVRRDEVMEEITIQIQDGEKELEDKIADAQKQIDDGLKQLEEGYIQLLVGEAQIAANETQITSGEKEITANEKLLTESEKQLNDGIKQLEEQSGMSFDEAATTMKALYSIYSLSNSLIDDTANDSSATLKENISAKTQEINSLTEENRTLSAESLQLHADNSGLEIKNNILTEKNNSLTQQNTLLEEMNKQLTAAGNIAQVAVNLGKIAANKAEIEANNLAIIANQATISANLQKIEENNTKSRRNTDRITRITKDISDLELMLKMLGNEVLSEVPQLINRLAGGDIETVYKGILQIENGKVQLESGKQQLEAAKLELEAGKKQIAQAKAQMAEGRAEYEKGKKELEDAQKELDEEYEKARIELDKARQQLEELPDATWTVLDHSMHYSTYMFENNADQIEKIGLVFPLLFFLVAALVCMTTMKRLVDEERSQIGVFSALGFSKNQITGKYVTYAFTASLLGSIISIPIGMAIFPAVIYFCWRLMYDLPDMVLTMPAYIAVLGVCSFTVLMALVTFIVVRGVLKENPSQLMRPKAPKSAKKVFLEHISFIWQRLSFTSKVTARNIIRYKSRFFMTVIGVAGCTSLLVLGFGIKGSISQVVSIQYGDIIRYDTTITLEDKDYTDGILSYLKKDSNVEYAVPFLSYSSKVYLDNEKTIQVYVMDENEIEDIIDLRQRVSKDKLDIDDGVVISEKFSKLTGVKVGDKITVESASGIKQAVEITGICEMYTSHYLFISEENYEYIFNETAYYDSIAVTSKNSEELIRDYEHKEGIKTIADFTAMKATFNNMFDSLDIIIVVIILAAGSLALVVIMNLTEVNISERIREIATLKVLGFNNQEVYSYIFKEVFILSLIGMLVGLPFGKLELVFVMDIIDMEMVMFSTVVQPTSYIYGFLITMVFTILVILLMRKTLRNVEMVESLKSVE